MVTPTVLGKSRNISRVNIVEAVDLSGPRSILCTRKRYSLSFSQANIALVRPSFVETLVDNFNRDP